MQADFYQKITEALSVERLDAYAKDSPDPDVPLARYALNMALCESLYSPLQLCEIALRNSLHRYLTALIGCPDWYDSPRLKLTDWAQEEVQQAKDQLVKEMKTVTPPGVVAELKFGFWCGMLEAHYEFRYKCVTSLFPAGIKDIFPKLPKSLHNRKKLKEGLDKIRHLRNRVFHHERIVHFADLDAQHASILSYIGWISPELLDVAQALDRYKVVRKQGLLPWLTQVRRHWPHPSQQPSKADSTPTIAILPDAVAATNGAETPFGHRWGGDVFRLSAEHLAALQAGQTLALDVQNEYIAFLKAAESAKLEQAVNSNLGGLGHGE